MTLEDQIVKALKTVRDPEIPVNIYDLGLIYGIDTDAAGNVKITMTLTAPNCPVAEALPNQVRTKVAGVPGVQSVEVKLTFDPPWNQAKVDEMIRISMGL